MVKVVQLDGVVGRAAMAGDGGATEGTCMYATRRNSQQPGLFAFFYFLSKGDPNATTKTHHFFLSLWMTPNRTKEPKIWIYFYASSGRFQVSAKSKTFSCFEKLNTSLTFLKLVTG